MSKRIYLSPPQLSGEELHELQAALQSNWIAPAGPATRAFEEKIAEYTGVPHVVAVNTGTSAIHLALAAVGVGPGDEVICPTLTFAGSCFPIRYLGATPVLIDAEPRGWNIDPALIETAIVDRMRKNKKPKAILVVHLFGLPADLQAISSIAQKYDIPVVEDAAEALGSYYQGIHVGNQGAIGIFSFNGNKILTTSGGGAVVTHRKEWADHVRYLSSQARLPVHYYQHEEVGFNYQLSNICAAVGLGQFQKLTERIRQRQWIFEVYRKRLSNLGFRFQKEDEGMTSNRWLTTVLTPEGKPENLNEIIRKALDKNEVEARLFWKPMHLQPVFSGCPSYLTGVADRLFNYGLCLPSGSALTETDLDRVVDIVLEA